MNLDEAPKRLQYHCVAVEYLRGYVDGAKSVLDGEIEYQSWFRPAGDVEYQSWSMKQ